MRLGCSFPVSCRKPNHHWWVFLYHCAACEVRFTIAPQAVDLLVRHATLDADADGFLYQDFRQYFRNYIVSEMQKLDMIAHKLLTLFPAKVATEWPLLDEDEQRG